VRRGLSGAGDRGRDAFRATGSRFIRKHTIGVAVGILVVVYGQMLLHPVSLAPHDPFDHHLASTMCQRAAPIAQVIADDNARAILTTDYPVMSWLRFYLRPQIPVIKVAEEYRFPDAPRATAEHFQSPLLYVALHDDMLYVIKRSFSRIEQIKGLQTPLLVYRVSGFKSEPHGRIP